MLPAAGQGALGIEVRAGRADLLELLAPLAHQADLAGGCRRTRGEPRHGRQLLDAAGRATRIFDGEYLQLRAAWGDPDGAGALVRAQRGRRRGRPRAGRRAGRRRRGAAARRRRPLRRCAVRVIVTRPASRGRALGRGPAQPRLRSGGAAADRHRARAATSRGAAAAWRQARRLSRRDVRERATRCGISSRSGRRPPAGRPHPCLGPGPGHRARRLLERRAAAHGCACRREPRSSIPKHCGSRWQARCVPATAC